MGNVLGLFFYEKKGEVPKHLPHLTVLNVNYCNKLRTDC